PARGSSCGSSAHSSVGRATRPGSSWRRSTTASCGYGRPDRSSGRLQRLPERAALSAGRLWPRLARRGLVRVGIGAGVGAVSALDRVAPRATLQGVVAARAEDGIVTRATDEDVVAAVADEQVVAAQAVQRVVAALAADDVVSGGAVERLGCVGAGDRAGLERRRC